MLYIFKLPFPPSVNQYWRNIRGRTLLSAKGRSYKKEVFNIIKIDSKASVFPLAGRLRVKIELYPADNRKRDVDNYLKAVLDAVGFAGVYVDDSQIDFLSVERKSVCKGDGYIVCMVFSFEESREFLLDELGDMR